MRDDSDDSPRELVNARVFDSVGSTSGPTASSTTIAPLLGPQARLVYACIRPVWSAVRTGTSLMINGHDRRRRSPRVAVWLLSRWSVRRLWGVRVLLPVESRKDISREVVRWGSRCRHGTLSTNPPILTQPGQETRGRRYRRLHACRPPQRRIPLVRGVCTTPPHYDSVLQFVTTCAGRDNCLCGFTFEH